MAYLERKVADGIEEVARAAKSGRSGTRLATVSAPPGEHRDALFLKPCTHYTSLALNLNT